VLRPGLTGQVECECVSPQISAGMLPPAPTLGWPKCADPDGLHHTANRGAELTDSHTAGEELVDPRWAIVPAAGETAGHAWSIAQTLGGELERVRLDHRTRRIERVLVSLRERRTERARAGAIPPALNQAIDDFTRELGAVQPGRTGARQAAAVICRADRALRR
jgi:hypothetical protein